MSPTERKGQNSTKNSGGPSRTEIQTAKPDKKLFDKRKWRENKYNNKVKGRSQAYSKLNVFFLYCNNYSKFLHYRSNNIYFQVIIKDTSTICKLLTNYILQFHLF